MSEGVSAVTGGGRKETKGRNLNFKQNSQEPYGGQSWYTQEEETSIEELFPIDWLLGESLVHFLGC